jgi:hypothetical protein
VHGSCHCGSVDVVMHLSRAPAATVVRECQCSFCRSHGARTIADPAGRAVIRAATSSALNRYRFELATADFLLCAHCGIYVGAVLEESGQAWAVLNVQGLRVPEFRAVAAAPVSYDGESSFDRVARRKANWMPCEIVYDPSLAGARRN